MSEREWLETVLALATLFRWRAWHVPMPCRPKGHGQYVPEPRGAGIPDLILIHDDPPRLIFAELKTATGRLTEPQREFLALADKVGHIARAVPVIPPPGPYYQMVDHDSPRAVRCYVWTPADRDQVEAILKSRVLA